MAKQYYIATRKDRSSEADALSETLKAHGWKRTFVWSDRAGDNPIMLGKLSVEELKGVRDADVLVVLLPGGFGTHVEIGAALALGKPVILCAPDQETLEKPYRCVFHYHPGVKLFVSETLDLDAILRCMEQCAGSASE